jgi:pimeloyl-ACP methyl ester carboxylesterase
MVKTLHSHHPNTLIRCGLMIVEPSRDWNVFKQIFVDHWDGFKEFRPRSNTPYYDDLVDKMLDCGKPDKMGYIEYRCLHCGHGKHLVSMSCKSSLCLRCAKVYVDNWVAQVSKMLHEGVIYRHIVLTVPDVLRTPFYRDADVLLSPFMQCGVKCLDDFFSTVSRRELKGGYIVVAQTHGRNGQYNPHLPIISTSGGWDEQAEQWVHLSYLPYPMLHRKWQWYALEMCREALPTNEMNRVVDACYAKYPNGFVANLEPRSHDRRDGYRYHRGAAEGGRRCQQGLAAGRRAGPNPRNPDRVRRGGGLTRRRYPIRERSNAMPIHENGPVKIHYEEAGDGFPLLVIPGGGLNATVAGLATHAFNPLEAFSDSYRVAALDLRNANGGQSEGPLDIERTWDAFTDDQLAIVDHLGFDRFVVMGFCIGGPMIWNLLKRAGDRVVAAVLVHPSGYSSSHPDIFYNNNIGNWAPEFCKRRPEVTMEIVSEFLNNMYTKRADFVFTVDRDFVRKCQTPVLILPDDIPAHPYATAMETALLAPNSQVSLYPWKENERKIEIAVRHIRSFMATNVPSALAAAAE